MTKKSSRGNARSHREFAEGDLLLLRHHTYRGYVFDVTDFSRDVVLEDVDVCGAAGVGVMIENGASRVRMTRLNIRPDPAFADVRRIPTTVERNVVE